MHDGLKNNNNNKTNHLSKWQCENYGMKFYTPYAGFGKVSAYLL